MDRDFFEKVSKDTLSTIESFVERMVLTDVIHSFSFEGPSRASTLSAATLTSLGGASSRKGSDGSSVTADTETSLQDIKVTFVLLFYPPLLLPLYLAI